MGWLRRLLAGRSFSAADYWERRYRRGRDSGSGSYGHLAEFKAEVLNRFVEERAVGSVIELGCGDGNQLSLARYPLYLGIDVSETVIRSCMEAFGDHGDKAFLWQRPGLGTRLELFLQADLTLSLDVIYHLVEDEVFDLYLQQLFGMSRRFVIVYSSNEDRQIPARHVRHRCFTDAVAERFADFRLIEQVPNRYPQDSDASFYIFEKATGPGA
ncbi:MAG: class I SAM-dependent methyltransferase [Phycisphaerae bacterium]|nr:class I SAM-dependent methyltransferase [Phycisphaerae bacterium]